MLATPLEAVLRQPIVQLNNAVIIDLRGEIDGSSEAAFDAAYDSAEAQNPATIVLNFNKVDYINSMGIALIVGLLARARKTKRTLTVFGLSEHYLDIFKLTRLVDFMSVYPDEITAIQQITTPTHHSQG
jgi:anti-anti-sigma factor